MSKATFLATFLAFAITCIAANKKIVCYYGSWANYRPGAGKFDVSNIDPTLCTHIIYTFVGLSPNGEVRVLDPWLDLPSGLNGFNKFTGLRQSNPNTKFMIAMGGWNEGSLKYSELAANPNTRAQFVQNVVKFLKTYNFDGFDLDWEYPNQRGGNAADKANFVVLLRELKQELNKHGFLLSIAVGAAESSASLSYLISQVVEQVDFVNLMAYDMNGSWDKFIGFNAPLYASSRESGKQAKLNVDSAVRYWLSQGTAADKIILGIPAYGRSFTLANAGNHDLGAQAIGAGNAGPFTREAGMLGYNEICVDLRQGGWTMIRDSEQRVPYAFRGNQWVGYDDVQSVREKVDYAKSLNLGGVMVWSLETDDFRGNCGERYPLMKTINAALNGDSPGPVPTPSTNPTSHPTSSPSTRPSSTLPSSTRPSSTLPTSTRPPINDICQQEGYVRDPNDCSTFYYCQEVHGKYVKSTFHCPDGLVFDPSFNGCNYRYLVPGC